METKFTKGPWKIYGDWGIQPADAKGDAKIFAQFSHDAECDNTQEGFANANLIKSAPEMYEMLKRQSELMDFLDKQTHPNIELDAVKHAIDKLLAKAQGE